MKLFVEGGGESKALRTECREGFNAWLRSIGLTSFPRIVASGSRNDAFSDYRTAIANGEEAILLVDSEDQVACQHELGKHENWLPWDHLKARDGWIRPDGCADLDCHLMVQCMENWFLGDPTNLSAFFGQGFQANRLPATGSSVEAVMKQAAVDGLKGATAACKTKGPYGKGSHSFKILKLLDATQVIAIAPWAKRFAEEMKKRFP